MAKITQQSIYIKLCRLRHLIKKMQYMMSKADRVIYGTELNVEINDCIKDFVLAYEYREQRDHFIQQMIADFAVLKVALEGINHEGLLREPNVKTHQASPSELPASTDKMYLRVFEAIGSVDTDITKWRNSLRNKTGNA